MDNYKCECGNELVFEKKKTFAIPDVKNAICIKCGLKYQLIDNKELIKKGGD